MHHSPFRELTFMYLYIGRRLPISFTPGTICHYNQYLTLVSIFRNDLVLVASNVLSVTYVATNPETYRKRVKQ